MQLDRASWIALSLACVVAAGLFGWRVIDQPLQPYGSNAAEYIEHAVRLEVAALEGWGPQRWAAADELVLSHPPLLHLVTSAAEPVVGRTAERVVWTGLGWHALLAAAMAACGWGLRRTRAAALAAGAAGLLFPAGLAAATRYHYDLPMTALVWCAVAAALWGRSGRAGAAAGLFWFAACLVKWGALVAGTPLVLAALVVAGRRAAVGWFVAGVVPVVAWIVAVPHSFEAGQMATGEDGGLAAVALAALGRVEVGRIGWYPAATAVALLSPVLVGALAPLLVQWWRGADRRERGVLIGGTVASWLALALAVEVLDERFALTAAPALLLAGALGSLEWRRWGLVALALAAVVGAEFHVLGGTQADRWLLASTELSPRGLWLGDSFERRGWSSRATTPGSSPRARAALAAALAACGVTEIGYVDGLSDDGDTWWLRYRSRLEGRERLILSHGQLGTRRFWWPDPDTDAQSHRFEELGYSPDAIEEPGAFSGFSVIEVDANMRALGLDPAALSHFQPHLAISRVPPPQHSPLDTTWRELVRIDEGDSEPIALHARGKHPCPP